MNEGKGNFENKSVCKESGFLRSMRYVSVGIATLWLFVLMMTSVDTSDFKFLMTIWIALVLYFITIPVIAFWIYSFIKAIFRRTKEDKIFLTVQIFDLVMLGTAALLISRPSLNCNADTMAEYYDEDNGFWMRDIVARYRDMLPDSTRLYFEIDYDKESHPYDLSDEDTERLRKELKDHGCIGIDVDNYTNWGYSRIWFRRVGMGMYSFRLYDKPLTIDQQDSINNDYHLIVYNDSTVFEYGGGAFGGDSFVGKKEFMEKLHKNL